MVARNSTSHSFCVQGCGDRVTAMRHPGKDLLMAADTLEEQLVKYLTDAHSIEEQALAQMRAAPDLAADPALADAFRAHETETERHEQLVRGRLEAHGASPSRLKDAVMAGGGKGTEQNDHPVRGRLEPHGASPLRLKAGVMAVGGRGFVLFPRSPPETDGKLAPHALSYEHLELASYELLPGVAERGGDSDTAA